MSLKNVHNHRLAINELMLSGVKVYTEGDVREAVKELKQRLVTTDFTAFCKDHIIEAALIGKLQGIIDDVLGKEDEEAGE